MKSVGMVGSGGRGWSTVEDGGRGWAVSVSAAVKMVMTRRKGDVVRRLRVEEHRLRNAWRSSRLAVEMAFAFVIQLYLRLW